MNLFVLILSAQLLYYLLIAQTGIVGAFNSDIHNLYTLPLGGITGGLLAAFTAHKHIKIQLYIMFFSQFILSFFYPHYSLIEIFILGFVVGYTAPLLFFIFETQERIGLAIGLCLSYVIGTIFYTYPFDQRGIIAFVLSSVSIIALWFLDIKSQKDIFTKVDFKIILILILWIFADSTLFETLSRSNDMDIWSKYTLYIIIFHIIGVIAAYKYPINVVTKNNIILPLFILSYILFAIKIPILLAIIYPFTISYYNFSLFSYIIKLNNIRYIAFSMIAIGWLATSMANAVALEKQLWVAYTILALSSATFLILNRRKI
ncbi:MAG: hypothetical protein PHI79_02425 [Sulfurovaceae bacterium]|nr:hypothetical protein [Sulfurovaceae bacterium]MDD5548433.1 hypothetical protein [Sulfurovaceae bacterium]